VALYYVKDPEIPVHKVWQFPWRGGVRTREERRTQTDESGERIGDGVSHAKGWCHG
jgi:hypothetical protein